MNNREQFPAIEEGGLQSRRYLQYKINRYAFVSQYVKGKDVLDIACGEGFGSRYLKLKGAKRVIGGDISDKAIECARNFYCEKGIEFMLMDAQRLPFRNNSYDVIVSLETIEHVRHSIEFLKECFRVLRGGGIFICSTPNGQVTPKIKSPDHIKEFSPKEFKGLLEEVGFHVKEFLGQDLWQEASKIEQALISIERLIIHRFSRGISLANLMGMLIYRREFSKSVNSQEVLKEIDQFLDKRYEPFSWEERRIVPIYQIAVLEKGF